jgi:hypothetical protein
MKEVWTKMIYPFKNEDYEYEKWCHKNPKGFVFNNFGGTDNRADMNKIHKVDCPYLWREKDEGKRTTTYEKICSETLEELLEFVKKRRGFSWSFCEGSSCFRK